MIMSKSAEWIENVLGAIKGSSDFKGNHED